MRDEDNGDKQTITENVPNVPSPFSPIALFSISKAAKTTAKENHLLAMAMAGEKHITLYTIFTIIASLLYIEFIIPDISVLSGWWTVFTNMTIRCCIALFVTFIFWMLSFSIENILARQFKTHFITWKKHYDLEINMTALFTSGFIAAIIIGIIFPLIRPFL